MGNVIVTVRRLHGTSLASRTVRVRPAFRRAYIAGTTELAMVWKVVAWTGITQIFCVERSLVLRWKRALNCSQLVLPTINNCFVANTSLPAPLRLRFIAIVWIPYLILSPEMYFPGFTDVFQQGKFNSKLVFRRSRKTLPRHKGRILGAFITHHTPLYRRHCFCFAPLHFLQPHTINPQHSQPFSALPQSIMYSPLPEEHQTQASRSSQFASSQPHQNLSYVRKPSFHNEEHTFL